MGITGVGSHPDGTGAQVRWSRSRALSAVFSRDVLMSLASSVVDVGLFVLACGFGLNIVTATFAARGVSAIFNFLGCKYLVFRSASRRRLLREAFLYAALALLLVTLSAGLVHELRAHTGMDLAVCKLLTDGGLYAVAFLVKRWSIFGRPRSKGESIEDGVTLSPLASVEAQ